MIIGFYNLCNERKFTLKVLINKAISWFCADFKSKFNGKWREVPSHCEIIFESELMFSADLFRNEVRIKRFNPQNSGHWTLISANCGEIDAEFMSETLGKKYDFWALFYFVSGFSLQSKNRWFCSELICAALQNANCAAMQGLIPHKTSPKMLYDILKGV